MKRRPKSIHVEPQQQGPLEIDATRQNFVSDVSSTFAMYGLARPEPAAAEISLRWKLAGHSKAQIVAALSSPELAALLAPELRPMVAKGAAWLQEEHEHVPTQWDY
jgi:hypothetical protein